MDPRHNKRLPEVCQPTGQVTCSNLTDVSKFPLNTNVNFTNVFDNQIDFARVDYIALEYIMVTPGPAPPPTVTEVRFASVGSEPKVPTECTLPVKSSGQIAVQATWETIPGFTNHVNFNEGPIDCSLVFAAADIPQLITGRTLVTPTDINDAINLYNNTLNASLPKVSLRDNGSFGTYVKLVAIPHPTLDPQIMPNTVSTLKTIHPTLTEEMDETRDYSPATALNLNRPNENMGTLTLQPVTTWTKDAFPTTEHGMSAILGWALVFTNKNETWENSNPSTVFALEALMSDGTTRALGSYRWSANIPPNIGVMPKALYGALSQEYISGASIIAPLPWPQNFHEAYDTNILNIFWWGWPLNDVAPSIRHYDGGPNLQTNTEVDEQTPTAAPMSIFLLTSAMSSLTYMPTEQQRTTKPPKPRFEPYAKLSAPTPTYDNIVQIICSELEVDRTAGSYNAQMLSVVPFNFAALASGFYLINIPVNSLVWRRITDVHIRSLTFGLYNGLGQPHPALAGQNFNVTLGLRYL